MTGMASGIISQRRVGRARVSSERDQRQDGSDSDHPPGLVVTAVKWCVWICAVARQDRLEVCGESRGGGGSAFGLAALRGAICRSWFTSFVVGAIE